MPQAERRVFDGRCFILAHLRGEVPTDKINELRELITSHGGEVKAWGDRLDTEVTPKLLIVAPSMGYEHSNEMRRSMVPTITEDWLWACIAEGRLVPTRPYSPDPLNFMRKVMISCSGLSDGDRDAICAGVRSAGGDSHDTLTKFTTHLIAVDPDADEVQTVYAHSDVDIKVVRPEWVDDCMKLQTLVDERPYLLKDPAESAEDDLRSTYEVDGAPRLAVQSSVDAGLGSSLFASKAFFLGNDLGLSDRLRKSVIYIIEMNEGSVVSNLNDADVYLGKWRSSEEYVQACRQKIVVGNLTWLYWMIIRRKWESPLAKLLHYPEVPGGLPEMHNFSIAISNYTGDARGYLQSLITSLGANYTSVLREGMNTHLVTAYEHGSKYEAAKRWGIKIVNHLWLEDTYAKWALQPENSRRYTYIPERLNLRSLVGNMHLIQDVLKKFYMPVTERAPHPKRKARDKADEWLHDAMIREDEFHEELRKHHGQLAPIVNDDTNKQDVEEAEKRTETPLSSASDSKTKGAKETSPTPAPKKVTRRTSSTTNPSKKPAKVRVLFTGVDDPPSAKVCSGLGMTRVSHPPAQVVIAPRFVRTPKFLCALADCSYFVTPEWFDASLKEGHPAEMDKFLIQDADLNDSLDNRRKLDGSLLFEDMDFFIEPSLKSKSDIIQQLVKAHGGVITRRNSSQDTIVLSLAPASGKITMDDFLHTITTMDKSNLHTDP